MTIHLAYKVEDGARELGISRAKMFELIRDGEVESIKIGRSRRIPGEALVAYIDRRRDAQRQADGAA